MSSAAVTSAPAAPVPSTPAAASSTDVADATSAAPVAPSAPKAANATAPTPGFTHGGKTYTSAELEAALNTHSTVDQAMKSLAKEKAEVNKAKEAYSSKDKSRIMAALREQGVPREVLAELAEEVLMAEIKDSEMTPEQRELETLRGEKTARAAEEAKRAEAEKQKALEAEVTHIHAAYETQFIQAMTESGLPRTPETMERLAGLVLLGIEAGYEVSPAEAAVLLRSRTVEANRPIYEGMSVDQLREALGPKAVEALIKAHTSGLQAMTSKAPDKRTPEAVAKTKVAGAKKRSLGDIIETLSAARRR